MASNLTPEQRKVVAELMAAPSWKRASPKVRKALLETAAVESNFSTPDQAHSDRDSEGALQQRPSQGWGPTSETNTQDAEQFLQRAMRIAHQYGNAGELAQAVQRSAFPDRYNQRSGIADALLGGGGGASRAGEGPIKHRSVPGFSVDIPTTKDVTSFDQAGFDHAKKLSILGAYLEKRNPNNPLLKAGVLSANAPSPGDFTNTTTETTTEKFTVPGTKASGGASAPAGGLGAKAFARASAIDAKHMPYLWGGGHGALIKDASKATPLDCSGAVSAVLGIDPRVASGFKKWGRPGEGGNVTIYAKDTHVLMKVRDPKTGQWRFFGTSGSNPDGGAGWIPASAVPPSYLAGFTVRHSER